MDRAVDYLSDPMTIVVIYSTAALGYLIDYMATLFVSSILRQKSLLRLEKIEKEKKKLEGRWGTKVNGERRLDDDGFPLDIGGDASDSAEESA